MSTVTILEAVRQINDVLSTIDILNRSAQAGSAVILKVQSEGREITSEEWNSAFSVDDVARAKLQAAIDADRVGP